MAPLDRSTAEAALREAIPDVNKVFESIDWTPLGSASIAQVHIARLRDGPEVVVKIRRPGVVEDVRRDGRVVVHLARLVERHSDWARVIAIADLTASLVRDLESELDLTDEARALGDVAAALTDYPVEVPNVYDELCSETVLVMDRALGVPLAAAELTGFPAEQRHQMATDLVGGLVGAMLEGRRFHADPHPGNVMVGPDGTLTLIDLGATGVLSTTEQASLSSLMLGLRLREPALLRDALLGVATSETPVDPARLDGSLDHLLAEHVTARESVGPEAIVELLRIMHDTGLRLPASASPMFRALVTILDSLEIIEPGFPVLDAIDELAPAHSPIPTSASDLTTLAREETIKLLPLLQRTPRLLDSVVTRVDRGDLTIHVRLFSNPTDARVVTRLVNRLALAFIAGVLGIVSAMLYGLDKGPFLTENLSIYDALASFGLLAGAVLVIRVVLEALDDDPRRTVR